MEEVTQDMDGAGMVLSLTKTALVDINGLSEVAAKIKIFQRSQSFACLRLSSALTKFTSHHELYALYMSESWPSLSLDRVLHTTNCMSCIIMSESWQSSHHHDHELYVLRIYTCTYNLLRVYIVAYGGRLVRKSYVFVEGRPRAIYVGWLDLSTCRYIMRSIDRVWKRVRVGSSRACRISACIMSLS